MLEGSILGIDVLLNDPMANFGEFLIIYIAHFKPMEEE